MNTSANITVEHYVKRALFFVSAMVLSYSVTGYSIAIAGDSYFDMTSTKNRNISAFTKWTGTMSRFAKQKQIPDASCDRIRFHPCSIKGWREMIDGLRGESLDDQIKAVNDWSNAHPYIEDQVNWGKVDYWETPYEFMAINGDCEDYAISKYYSLRALGVSADRLRIIVLQDLNLGGIIHAVLGVYDDNDRLQILDNQSKRVKSALSIYHYRPVYGINESAWWEYQPRRN